MGLVLSPSHQILEFLVVLRTFHLHNDMRTDRMQLDSYRQFVYQLISGNVRRNTFTQWEMDLLFDLEKFPVRKSRRAQILRRYVKATNRHISDGASAPPRLAEFLQSETPAYVAAVSA